MIHTFYSIQIYKNQEENRSTKIISLTSISDEESY